MPGIENTIEISLSKLVAATLVLLVSGNAGNIYTAYNPDLVRPNPFTSLDGRDLEKQFNKIVVENNKDHAITHNLLILRIAKIEWDIADCHKHHSKDY